MRSNLRLRQRLRGLARTRVVVLEMVTRHVRRRVEEISLRGVRGPVRATHQVLVERRLQAVIPRGEPRGVALVRPRHAFVVSLATLVRPRREIRGNLVNVHQRPRATTRVRRWISVRRRRGGRRRVRWSRRGGRRRVAGFGDVRLRLRRDVRLCLRLRLRLRLRLQLRLRLRRRGRNSSAPHHPARHLQKPASLLAPGVTLIGTVRVYLPVAVRRGVIGHSRTVELTAHRRLRVEPLSRRERRSRGYFRRLVRAPRRRDAARDVILLRNNHGRDAGRPAGPRRTPSETEACASASDVRAGSPLRR